MFTNNSSSLLRNPRFIAVLIVMLIVMSACDEPAYTPTPNIEATRAASCTMAPTWVSLQDLIPGAQPGEVIEVKVEVSEIGTPSTDPNQCPGQVDFKAEAWTQVAHWQIADKGLAYKPGSDANNIQYVISGTTYDLPRTQWSNMMLYRVDGAHRLVGHANLVIGSQPVYIPVRNAGAVHVTIVRQGGETALTFPQP